MDKITISDVARLAKVSPSSVSNVLNGRSERMKPSTKERIQHAIEQLGYTPNLAARQLKTGHHHHRLHTLHRIPRAVGVDRRQRTIVPRVHRLQHVECL